MKKVLCLLLVVLLSVSMFLLAGCGKSTSGNSTAKESAQTEQEAQQKAQESEQPLEIKWLGNPVSAGLFPSEDSFVVQELNKRFNVKLKIVKAQSNKPQEMNMLFASGEIPDHFFIRAADIARIVNEGVVRDIPVDMVKEIAPTYWNAIMENHAHILKSDFYKDGNLKTLPQGQGELFNFTVLRTDWLEKVGAKMPTNLEEFEEVCRLFTQADPDGNNKDDTYAFTLKYDTTKGYCEVYTLAAAFGISLPGGVVKDDSWIKDANGNLIRTQISLNYKEFVKYLAKLYEKGYIYPDLTIKEDHELFSDGIVGIKTHDWTQFMPKYRPSGYFALMFKKNPQATTDYMPALKGFNGQEATWESQSSVWRYMCIGKDTSDAKLKKILEIIEAQLSDMEVHNLVWRGVEGTHFTVNEEGMAIMNSDFSSKEQQAELGIKYFLANYRYGEQRTLSFGKEALVQQEFQKDYNVIPQLIPSGTVINSVNEYGADVKKIESEFFVNAVAGIWDVDAEWDKYIDRWYKAGGNEITEEVNEIYKKLNK